VEASAWRLPISLHKPKGSSAKAVTALAVEMERRIASRQHARTEAA
jgi:hypothetical protein